MKAIYFDSDNGEDLRYEDIPADMVDEAEERREMMLDTVSMFSDRLTEAMLEKISRGVIVEPAGVISLGLSVFCGSAYKNKGVQPLMDAVSAFLPSPVTSRTTPSVRKMKSAMKSPIARMTRCSATPSNWKMVPTVS